MARLPHPLLALLALAATAGPAQALYKVVGPDGKITYTDRAPDTATPGKVTGLSASGAPAADASLPQELRQPVSRYPVTLYTAPDCAPCDEARNLLRQRGIPYTEKTATSAEDREAWGRIVGGPESPAVKIGGQSLRGLQADRWNEYLDAAGYPKQSKLPANYQWPTAEPLIPRQAAATRTPPPITERNPLPPASPSTGIRF
jgi:glutaredoxin